MDYMTRRNVAIIALLQIGLIVFGCLLAFISIRWNSTFKLHSSDSAAHAWVNFGWIGLILPLAWVSFASHVIESDDWTNTWKYVSFFSGIVFLGFILFAIWSGVAILWFRIH